MPSVPGGEQPCAPLASGPSPIKHAPVNSNGDGARCAAAFDWLADALDPGEKVPEALLLRQGTGCFVLSKRRRQALECITLPRCSQPCKLCTRCVSRAPPWMPMASCGCLVRMSWGVLLPSTPLGSASSASFSHDGLPRDSLLPNLLANWYGTALTFEAAAHEWARLGSPSMHSVSSLSIVARAMVLSPLVLERALKMTAGVNLVDALAPKGPQAPAARIAALMRGLEGLLPRLLSGDALDTEQLQTLSTAQLLYEPSSPLLPESAASSSALLTCRLEALCVLVALGNARRQRRQDARSSRPARNGGARQGHPTRMPCHRRQAQARLRTTAARAHVVNRRRARVLPRRMRGRSRSCVLGWPSRHACRSRPMRRRVASSCVSSTQSCATSSTSQLCFGSRCLEQPR